MANYDKNLPRALAILATHPDGNDIAFQSNRVLVAEQELCLENEDDLQVLSILMASSEFGFAVTNIEVSADILRDMQKDWFEAADLLKKKDAAV